jgi:cell fate (sporulation/competence/biofilm development) regulator YmcA (YheA/YmcA/DUF963 family)
MNDIIKEINELIITIKGTDTYKNYLHILNQVEDSEDINHLVSEIKKLQQDAVKEESINHQDKVLELDKIINSKINELNNIPLYIDYINACNEVNNLLNLTKEKFQTYFDNII